MRDINRYQRLLLEAYPDLDLLPIDPKDHREVDDTVRSHETGDTLFDFLWLELGDVGDAGPEDALRSLDQAIAELQKVRDHIASHDADVMLETLRREQAEKAFEVYDFRDAKIAAADGWQLTKPGREWTRTIYFENSVDPQADSIKGHFSVLFAGDTASVVESAAAVCNGAEIGEWKSSWMKSPKLVVANRRMKRIETLRDQAAHRTIMDGALGKIEGNVKAAGGWVRDQDSNEWRMPFVVSKPDWVDKNGELVVRFAGDESVLPSSVRIFLGSEAARRNEIIKERRVELGRLYNLCRFEHDVMAYGEWGRKDDLDTWQLDIRFLDTGRWSVPGRVVVRFAADGSTSIEKVEAFLRDEPIKTGLEPKSPSPSPGM